MDLGFEARLAKEYTADVYRNNTTARTRMNQWMQEHGDLEDCNAAKPLTAIADVMDAFVLEDGVEKVPELINTEGYERICRWGYGLGQVFLNVRKPEEWKEGSKRKTRWDLLALYHPSAANLGESRILEADLEVQGVMSQQALFRKWLEKSKTA